MNRTLTNVLLASASPRRRDLLASVGLHVSVIASDYDERPDAASDPRELATIHARGKNLAARTFAAEGLVVGADTVVDVDGIAFGKPRDRADAKRMVTLLSGRTHAVHTAMCLRDLATNTVLEELVSTAVTFAALDESAIDAYTGTGDGMDKAGAYGIQGIGATLVARVEGDFYAVMGFPLCAFALAVGRLGYRLPTASLAGSTR
jgi:septum formation protein